jgi:3-hydroxy-9,10-secoandrosta-1,3,5(10)-triene-9,17-dione monooxygenase reductase component
MSVQATFDPTEFRRALGSFATGVTIITTRAADGTPIGLTVNSFNSVSLNPPLVLWSLAETSLSLPTFRAATHWAVHVLASDQEDLSGRFARRGENKFSGLDIEEGAGAVPLLPGCAARFECRTAFQYEGGDHVIFVGEVLAFNRAETAPLVFHGGRYAHATRREAGDNQLHDPYLAGSFNEGFLGYLLGRSHFEFFRKIRPHLAQEQLDDEEFYVLSTLTLKRTMSESNLEAGMAGVLGEGSGRATEALIRRGLVAITPGTEGTLRSTYQLTEAGGACALRLISASKAVESQILDRLGAGESAALKTLLNRLLHQLDPDVEALWEPGQSAETKPAS